MCELAGLQLFYMLDLRAGYHRIWMREGGVGKTSFKTHLEHLQLHLLPFALTNVPHRDENRAETELRGATFVFRIFFPEAETSKESPETNTIADIVKSRQKADIC